MRSLRELQYPIGEFNPPAKATEPHLSEWIAALEALPEQLRRTVSPLKDEQLATPYRPGGWSLRQVVHHIADSHMTGYIRTKWALTEDRPLIKAYDQDRWSELPDVVLVPISVSLDLLDGLHARWAGLARALNAEQLARTFDHPESGATVPLFQHIANYAWHGEHHLAQIESLLRREGWA